MPKNKDYDRRIFRLFYILNKLNNSKPVTTRELAEEFNVSMRTVQRDLEILNSAGFFLSSPKRGIYQFEEGYSLKKVELTNEEASLLSFLYDVSKSLGKKFEESFQKILKKVIQKEYEFPFYAKIPESANLKENYPFLENLEEAICENQKVKIKYQKDQEIKTFTICPLKLIYYDGFWYLLSQIESKGWLLKFRLENIKEVELLDEYFVEPENLKTMLEQSMNIWFSEKKKNKVLLKIDKEVAPFFKQRKYFPYQKIIKENKDSSLIIEAKVSDYMEAIPTILGWIPHISVIKPKEMKEQIKERISNYINKNL
jgi:predicted DNA-binding transcriptional regulator YafY